MDWKSQYHTKEDFERAIEETQKKKEWGRWKLDIEEYPSLDICPTPNSAPYQIRLFERGCDFPTFTAWLGHWVQHIQEKSWLSPQDLWDFVDAAQDVYRRGAK
jgi:hypothetical protein